MIKLKSSCILQGNNFSPSLAESKTGLSFFKKNEVGEIGDYGRYKNKAMPYGSAEICKTEKESSQDNGTIDYVIDILTRYIDVFRLCHAENIVLHMDVEYDSQCNFELSSDLLAQIANLKIPLTVSCYSTE
jgi:hypothetical protein